MYYVPTANPDPYPPALDDYLASIASKIGAEVTWEETNDNVYSNFAATGALVTMELSPTRLMYLRRLDEKFETQLGNSHQRWSKSK